MAVGADPTESMCEAMSETPEAGSAEHARLQMLNRRSSYLNRRFVR